MRLMLAAFIQDAERRAVTFHYSSVDPYLHPLIAQAPVLLIVARDWQLIAHAAHLQDLDPGPRQLAAHRLGTQA